MGTGGLGLSPLTSTRLTGQRGPQGLQGASCGRTKPAASRVDAPPTPAHPLSIAPGGARHKAAGTVCRGASPSVHTLMFSSVRPFSTESATFCRMRCRNAWRGEARRGERPVRRVPSSNANKDLGGTKVQGDGSKEKSTPPFSQQAFLEHLLRPTQRTPRSPARGEINSHLLHHPRARLRLQFVFPFTPFFKKCKS